jgi:hypothetical protein
MLAPGQRPAMAREETRKSKGPGLRLAMAKRRKRKNKGSRR